MGILASTISESAFLMGPGGEKQPTYMQSLPDQRDAAFGLEPPIIHYMIAPRRIEALEFGDEKAHTASEAPNEQEGEVDVSSQRSGRFCLLSWGGAYREPSARRYADR